MFIPVSLATSSENLASFKACSPVDSRYVLKFRITMGVRVISLMIIPPKEYAVIIYLSFTDRI